MKSTVFLARRQGRLSHLPARCPRGMVGECRPQTVRRQPIRRWTASSRSRLRSAKNSFGVPPLKALFASSEGREVRRCPVPRLPRLACPIQRTAAGASAHSPRAARAAPRTAPTPAPTPLACAHHRPRRCRPSPGPHPATNTRVRRRPTPPAPVPVGGWAAGGRVTSGCARESVGLRRCTLLGGAAGGGAAEACACRRCDVHEPIADATGAAPPLPPPPPPPPSLRHPRHRHHHRHTLTLLSPPPAFSARRSVAARSSARTGDHAARKVTRDK